MIGEETRKFLQQDQRVVNHAVSTAQHARFVHFRRQIMVIKDKALAKHFVKSGDKYKRVRRVVSVDNVKTAAKKNDHRYCKAGGGGVCVFPNVSEKAIRTRRLRIAIYAHTFDHFPRWLPRLRRTDDGNGVARSGQRIRFPADAHILRVSLILQQHQDAIIGGRFHKHLFVEELQPAPESDGVLW